MHTLTLEILPGEFSICRLPQDAAPPELLTKSDFCSVTWAAGELSVVVPSEQAQPDWTVEPGWRCLKLVGSFELDQIGVLAAVTGPLAEAGVSIYPLATWTTDYLLVRQSKLQEACRALDLAGHSVVDQGL